jgi:serine/threonine-protein kinase RsbW
VKDGSPRRADGASRSVRPDPIDLTFRAGDLPLVRRRTASWALRAGMAAGTADDFVIAVNEIATNAVRHGSPEATLRLWADKRAGMAEIRDRGHWPGAMAAMPVPRRAPEHGGMGLEVARMVCDGLQIDATDSGTVVQLRMSLGPSRGRAYRER